jgi:hypothetical protein
MHRYIRAVRRVPELWYGLLAWLFLSVWFTLPPGLELWSPQAHEARMLTGYANAPVVQWLLALGVLLFLGIVGAWRHDQEARAVIGAMVAVILVLWGTWLVYWAVTDLALTLWRWTTPPDTESQEQAYYIWLKIINALVGSVPVVVVGAMFGAIGGLLGFALRTGTRMRRIPDSSHPA